MNDPPVGQVRLSYKYCVKSVQIGRFTYSVQIRGNTDQKKLRIWTLILDPQCKDVINDEKLDLNGKENKF